MKAILRRAVRGLAALAAAAACVGAASSCDGERGGTGAGRSDAPVTAAAAADSSADASANAAPAATRPAPQEVPTTVNSDSSGFTFTLPPGVKREDVVGLDVTLKAVRPTGSEPVFVQLSAQSVGSLESVATEPAPIGSYTVFKPLGKGEALTASLKAPPAGAWTATEKGAQTVIHFDVKPAHPDRVKPDVQLEIVDVKPALRK